MSRPPDAPQVLGHSDEADGIEEYDNRLPAWWLGLFYFTVAWGIAYGVHYHFVGNRSEAAEYDAEVAEAKARWLEPEPTAALANAAADPNAGEATYQSTCMACHGPDLHGGIGPNLTDDAWIRGTGTVADIAEIVTNGSTAKGMPAWGPVLGPQKVAAVAAYVHSKHVGGMPGPEGAAVKAPE